MTKQFTHLVAITTRFANISVFRSCEQNFTPSTLKLTNVYDFEYFDALENYLQELQLNLEKADNEELEQELLSKSQVIFATLSVTGRKAMEVIKPVDALIVDEATQAVEAETLIPFSLEPTKCLLIGDTKQLPATVISQKANIYNYGWSMMWRLIEECRVTFGLLDTQYRMEPEISMWPAKKYYNGLLKNSAQIVERANPFLIQQKIILTNPYIFIDVRGKEEPVGYSFQNKQEAFLALQIVKFFSLKRDFASKKIGIISFYAGQIQAIKKKLQNNRLFDVRVHTVDGFQGDEEDLIIISFVRANPKGIIGFLQDFRRLNVAITRAKFMLIMLGNAEVLCQKRSDVSELITDAKNRNRLFTDTQLLKGMETKKGGDKNRYKKDKSLDKRGFFRRNQTFHKRKTKDDQKKKVNNPNYKTEMCKFFKRGLCSKGDNCTYAHSKTELRSKH